MLEADGTSPHTAHTTNPVPLILTKEGMGLMEKGELSDLMPTALALLGFRSITFAARPAFEKILAHRRRSFSSGARRASASGSARSRLRFTNGRST